MDVAMVALRLVHRECDDSSLLVLVLVVAVEMIRSHRDEF